MMAHVDNDSTFEGRGQLDYYCQGQGQPDLHSIF